MCVRILKGCVCMQKQCFICQQNRELFCFAKNKRKKDGLDTRCKECMSLKRKNWKSEDVYKKYCRDAKRRGLIFLLTKQDFVIFQNRSCHYCNAPLDKVRLDRVDNQIGYLLNNVVPCCAICNRLKGTLGLTDFLQHITKIYSFQKGKIND